MASHTSPSRSGHRVPLSDASERLNVGSPAQTTAHKHKASRSEYDDSVRKASTAHYASSSQVGDENHGRRPERDESTNSKRFSTASRESRQNVEDDEARRVSKASTVSRYSTCDGFPNKKTHIGPWQLGKTLGKGSSARVRAARHSLTHQPVAVKIVSKHTAHITQAPSLAKLDQIDSSLPDNVDGVRRMPLAIEREVAILKLIEHPNIVKLYDIWENRDEIYLILEYVENGDLFEFISRNGALTEEQAMFVFRQIMAAVEYCHSYNICHRDLKPENILLKADGQVKIADFGMAALHQGPQSQLNTSCGSPHYAAPELLKARPYRGEKADIWSMGVILFAMMAGRLPFDEEKMNVMLAKAKKGIYEMPAFFSNEAKDLIHRILQVDPDVRISMQDMWKHPLVWKYGYLDELKDDDEKDSNQPPDVRGGKQMTPLSLANIDMQVLRQLRSMWHTIPEKDLVAKLVSEEANDQKLFYWLLYNYRERQLENYNPDMTYSKSDYHLLKPANWGRKVSTRQFVSQSKGKGGGGHGRSISRFTVISNAAETEAGTVRSYDPYKSSLVMHPSQASHAKITIHRNASDAGSQVSSGPSGAAGAAHRQRMQAYAQSTASSRIQSPRSSVSSLRSGSRQGTTPRVRVANSRYKRGVDFSSIRMRSADNYNPYNQGHGREPGSMTDYDNKRRSNSSYQAPASIAGDETTYDRDVVSPQSPHKRNINDRPPRPPPHGNTSSLGPAGGRSNSRGARTSGRYDTPPPAMWIEEELAQFSSSIAKDCDEAFSRSLLTLDEDSGVTMTGQDGYESGNGTSNNVHGGSSPFSLRLSVTPVAPDKRATGTVGTTSTSAQAQSGGGSGVACRPWDSRPLPPPPPRSDSVQLEIMQGRQQQQWQRGGAEVNYSRQFATVSDSTRRLENENVVLADDQRRVVSAPVYAQYSRAANINDSIGINAGLHPLPSIYEASPDSHRQQKMYSGPDKLRIVSAPSQSSRRLPAPQQDMENRAFNFLAQAENTIRVVNSPTANASNASSSAIDPALAPQPLNVRRKLTRAPPAPASPSGGPGPDLRQRYHQYTFSGGPGAGNGEATMMGGGGPMAKSASAGSGSMGSGHKKKRSWFRRSSKSDSNAANNVPQISVEDASIAKTVSQPGEPTPPRKKGGFLFPFWRSSRGDEAKMSMSLAGPDYEDLPSPEAATHRDKKKKATRGVIAKYYNSNRAAMAAAEAEEGHGHDHNNHMIRGYGAAGGGSGSSNDARREIEPQQNWLARLFRVRPATRHLCLSIPRRRARQEVAILLREWRRFGMRDVEVDKARNLVFARVGRQNAQGMREVAFACEVITVIEHLDVNGAAANKKGGGGGPAGNKNTHLSIVRFTQEKGAASSFHRVVQAVGDVFGSRGLLVADKRKAKMMIKTLNS